MTKRYDAIILGGGNAGFGASAVLHEAGKSLAFVEDRDFGGTCPNRGCTPKKVLVAAAHALHEIDTAGAHGIEVGPAKLDWAKLIDRKQDMIGFIPDAMLATAEIAALEQQIASITDKSAALESERAELRQEREALALRLAAADTSADNKNVVHSGHDFASPISSSFR